MSPTHLIEWWTRDALGSTEHSGMWLDLSGGEYCRAMALAALDHGNVVDDLVWISSLRLNGNSAPRVAADRREIDAWRPELELLPVTRASFMRGSRGGSHGRRPGRSGLWTREPSGPRHG